VAPTGRYTTTYLHTFAEILSLISQTSSHDSNRPMKVRNKSHVVVRTPIAYTDN